MRSNGDIHGYRYGPTWKFKRDEIERVINEKESEARNANDTSLKADEDFLMSPSDVMFNTDDEKTGDGADKDEELF